MVEHFIRRLCNGQSSQGLIKKLEGWKQLGLSVGSYIASFERMRKLAETLRKKAYTEEEKISHFREGLRSEIAIAIAAVLLPSKFVDTITRLQGVERELIKAGAIKFKKKEKKPFKKPEKKPSVEDKPELKSIEYQEGDTSRAASDARDK